MLCIFLLHPSYASAQKAYSFDLGEILISKDEEVVLGSNSISEISYRDIEIRNAQTVQEALEFIPGIRITTGSKNEPYVKIRGFNQDKVLILLDGIPVASPYYGYIDLNQIPSESIAKIKVLKGLVSPLYGANAMGGVINIITKTAGEKPYLQIDNGTSINNTHYHIFSYGAKIKDITYWSSGSFRKSDGYELSRDFKAKRNEDGKRRENSYYEKKCVFFKIGLKKPAGHNLITSFNYINNENGISPHVSSSKPKYWRFTQWKRLMLSIVDKIKIIDNFFIKCRVFYDKYDNTLKSFDDATYTTQHLSSSWTSTYDEYSLGTGIYVYLKSGKAHSLKGTINFKKDVHKEQDDIEEPWETHEIHTYSIAAQDDIKISDKLCLSIGANLDLFKQARSTTERRGADITSFNPMLFTKYSPDPATSVYLSVSKRTRFPTLNQLYSQTSGNPDLKEQKNINFETGLKRSICKASTFELSYFYNNVNDLIERASKNDPFLNISKAIFQGLETDAQLKIGRSVSCKIGYTYIDAQDKNPELLGHHTKKIAYTPKHKADLELNYYINPVLSCHLLGSYCGQRYYYDSDNIQQSLGGYFVWNVKLIQRLLKNWQISITIENIFDRNYQEEEGYPQPGRTIFFSVKGSF